MEKIAITKNVFIDALKAIRRQEKHDEKCRKAFSVILKNDFVSGYDNNIVVNKLVQILKKATKDDHKDSWIDYFIYELEFGKKYIKGCATRIDGSDINLSTASKLWDFLNE